MPLFLHVEVDGSLSLTEFRERVMLPLKEALEREALGHLLDLDDEPEEDNTLKGVYKLALEVTDQERAREIVEKVLKSVDRPAEPYSVPGVSTDPPLNSEE